VSRRTARSRPAAVAVKRTRVATPSLRRPASRRTSPAAAILDPEASLLDVVDNLLNRGVVLTAEITLALANVDLVYVRLSALLCAADRVMAADGDR
jgi:hypothetical protein